MLSKLEKPLKFDNYSFPIKNDEKLGLIQLVCEPHDIDKEAARSILIENFIGEYEKYLKPHEIREDLLFWRKGDKSVRKYYEDYFQKEFDKLIKGDIHYWVEAKIGNKLVGWATFLREKLDAHSVYMDLLIVHPQYQKMGIGEQLVQSLMKMNVIHDLSSIHILLRKKNQGGKCFYQRLGFYADPSYLRADNFVDLDLLEPYTCTNFASRYKSTFLHDNIYSSSVAHESALQVSPLSVFKAVEPSKEQQGKGSCPQQLEP